MISTMAGGEEVSLGEKGLSKLDGSERANPQEESFGSNSEQQEVGSEKATTLNTAPDTCQ